MEYHGNSARVFSNGKWSKFMSIHEAERFERDEKVQGFLSILRAGREIVALRADAAAVDEARRLFQKEK